jgi:TolB-like protein
VDALEVIAAWITENEQLLSGLAAIVAVVGVVLTPIGLAMRRRRSEAVLPPLREAAALGADASPSPAKSEVASSPAPSTSRPRAAASGRPSLAVLPFLNLSEDREQEFLADGMTEDLITGLAANRHLSVVSRNSTFAYKGESPDIRDVGRELDVRYVLEGSVRRIGDRMRTTAQLIEASTGDHLWAEKYDRPYAEMFDVQDDVVASIAGALNAQLSDAEFQRARREQPSDLGAWERVHRGLLGAFRLADGDSMRRGVEELRAAVAIDPDYAYARSALAWCLNAAAINGYAADPAAMMREAMEHLRVAIEGSSDDPLTLFYAGSAHVYCGRFDRGIELLDRSLVRNPHQPDVHMHLGIAHGYLGHFDRAHAHFDRAEELAPTGGMSIGYGWYRAQVLGFEGRYAESVPLLESQIQVVPRYPVPRICLALDLDALGRTDEARAEIERAARIDPEFNIEGVALQLGAHPDPETGAARAAKLREYWPA